MGRHSQKAASVQDALVFDEDAQRDGVRPVGALAKRKQKRKGDEVTFDPKAHK